MSLRLSSSQQQRNSHNGSSRRLLGSSIRGMFVGDDTNDCDDDLTASMHSSMTSIESFQSPSSGKAPLRRSFRQSFTHALASPVKMAKEKISLTSPGRLGQSMRNSITKTGENARSLLVSKKESSEDWREELDIPPEASEEDALAILLCKELECMDL